MVSDSGNGGNSSDQPKTRLIWAIIPATLVCTIIIGLGFLKAAEYEWQADKQIADYAEYTKSKKANGCVHAARADKIVCLNAASDAYREYRYNQRDLVAQKTSALWAFIMGAAAVIGMALSAVGVWLVRETFIATVGTNKITQKQLDDARLMARPIMDIAVRLATTPESWPPYSHYLRMSIRITNRGNTEARDVSIVNATVKLTKRSKAISFYDTALAKGRDIYGNGASATVELDPRKRVFLKDITFAKGKTAIIALEYSYQDSFGNKVTLSEQLEGAWVMDDSSATCAAAQKIPKN